jgi:phosphoglycerol transferase
MSVTGVDIQVPASRCFPAPTEVALCASIQRGARPGEKAVRLGQQRVLKAVAHTGILVTLVAGALWLYVLPREFRIDLPIAYGQGDSLFDAHYVKRILETGWYPWQSHRLGAPFETNEYDMPEALWVHYAVLKVIGLFSNDWVTVANVFALSGFFLTALSSYAVLRWIQLEPRWSMLGALVFAFLPYHFFRIVPLAHTFLAAYWNVPIAIGLALWSWRPQAARPSTSAIVRLAGAILVSAAGGVYYAFFACFLIVLAGAASALAQRRWRAAIPAGACVLAISLIVGIQLIPSVLYWSQNGRNPVAATRLPSESEVQGFKPIQLVIPHPAHRLQWARDTAGWYNKITPLVTENASAALGCFGSIGLLVLIGAAVKRLISPSGEVSTLDKLSFLALAAIALGTVGGVGSIVDWTLTPLIRGYNRISVFIAFFSIAALLLTIQALIRFARVSRAKSDLIAGPAAVAVALCALWDQTTPFDQKRLQATFESDREFVQRVEAALPARTAVYQLPYHGYPEGDPVNQMADYDLLRGYLHSRELRWSYGGMKGRPGDRWLQSLSTRPMQVQLDAAAARGFGAVYVERRAYRDHGQSLEAELRTRLGAPLATDRAGNLVVYRLVAGGAAAATRDRTRVTR